MWVVKEEIFNQLLLTLPTMLLDIYVRSFYIRKEKLHQYEKLQTKVVVVYTPEVSSKSTFTNYPSCCYFNLLKYKPWIKEPKCTYDAPAGSYEDDLKIKVCQNIIVAAWRIFLDEFENDAAKPDY